MRDQGSGCNGKKSYLCRWVVFWYSTLTIAKMRSSLYFLPLLLVASLFQTSCQNTDTSASAPAAGDSLAASGAVRAETPAPGMPIPTEGLRIAWVNMDSLLHGYDYYFEMEREMANLTSQAERELTEKGKVLEKRVAKFQDDMQKGLLTRSEAQRLQEELTGEQARFLQLQEAKRQQLTEEEQVRLRKVQSAISDFIGRYNAERGYNYILSVGMLYADPRLSITGEVLAGLNAEYASSKGAAQEAK